MVERSSRTLQRRMFSPKGAELGLQESNSISPRRHSTQSKTMNPKSPDNSSNILKAASPSQQQQQQLDIDQNVRVVSQDSLKGKLRVLMPVLQAKNLALSLEG